MGVGGGMVQQLLLTHGRPSNYVTLGTWNQQEGGTVGTAPGMKGAWGGRGKAAHPWQAQ